VFIAVMIRALSGLLYPVAVYFALQWFEPRVIAAVLAVFLLLRWKRQAAQILAGLSGISHGILIALLLLCVAVLVVNNETLLRLYPAAINLGLLTMFGMTLWQAPPMIERFARLRHTHLSAESIRYTRHVTHAWCLFFVGNGLIAAWTAIAASRETWALYNGFIAYLLMGALFAGEWLLRRYRFPVPR
jgi:uncharacterized membrane protein